MNVKHEYMTEKSKIHHITEVKTVWFILKRKMRRPIKKRNREKCSIVGNPSTATEIRDLSTPSAKNVRIRARFSGLHRGGRVTLTYRRDQWCIRVANRAQVRLITRLKDQREFTQTAYFEGEKGGGFVTVGGMGARGRFGSVKWL